MESRLQLNQTQKLDIWREIGRRHGCPPKGTPDYEAKKDLYHSILLEGEARLNGAPAKMDEDDLPSDREQCCCDCHLRRPVQSPPPRAQIYSRPHSRPIDVDLTDSEEEEVERQLSRRRQLYPLPKEKHEKSSKLKTKGRSVETSSDESSDYETECEDEKPRRGRPPKKATTGATASKSSTSKPAKKPASKPTPPPTKHR